MALTVYSHPLSSFCQKALTALYEKGLAFETRLIDGSEPVASDFAALSPVKRFPILVDGGRTIFEATSIVEHLDLHHPGPARLIPADGDAAGEVRMLDRFFDNYVSIPQGAIVFEAIRPDGVRDAHDVARHRAMLDGAYAWLDAHLATREWAAAGQFSMADCAAAPALLYADWTHPIPARFAAVHGYRARLLARPSYARALDEARPYRHMFPLGAPTDRD